MAKLDVNKLIGKLEDARTSIEEVREQASVPEELDGLEDAEQAIDEVASELEQTEDNE